MFLEVVMATKELRKTKVSFDTYHIPKSVLGVFFFPPIQQRKRYYSKKEGNLAKMKF